jgi:hypothetical protein
LKADLMRNYAGESPSNRALRLHNRAIVSQTTTESKSGRVDA